MKRVGGGSIRLALKQYHLTELIHYVLLRVAAFGFHAGYAGAALALLDWAWQLEHGNKEALPGKSHYQHKIDLDLEVKKQVSKGVQKNKGKPPRVLVIGSLGRCGTGVSRLHVILDQLLI